MTVVLTVLHVLVCVFLVAVVLLQRGKGAEIGAVFGSGASTTVFGGRGAGNFLTKLTTGSAIVFMLTSLSLSYLAAQSDQTELFADGVEEVAEESAPFEEVGTAPAEEPAAALVEDEFTEVDVVPPDAAEAAEGAAPEGATPPPATP